MFWNGLKSDLKHLSKHKFRGGCGKFVKNKTHKAMKTLKNVQKQATLIASVKMLNIGFINKPEVGVAQNSSQVAQIAQVAQFALRTMPFFSALAQFALRSMQCWALPQTGPQVRKSANCGLKVLVCGFANRFLTANICGLAVKKLKSTANPQINSITEIVSAISKKKRLYDSVYRQIWVDVFLMYNILSPSSSAVGRLFPRGATILTAK